MKIGFSVEDYNWNESEIFAELLNSLKYSGHQIYLMGSNKSKDLLNMAAHKMPVPDYYLEYGKDNFLISELSIILDGDEDTFAMFFQDVTEEG
jgi:hypothetical protein